MAQKEELTIEELKEKYGRIYELEIPFEDDAGEVTTEFLYLRKLDRKTYSAGAKIMQKNEMQGVEMFLRSLTVQGDVEKVISDFDALRTAAELIVEVIGVRPGNVRKV